MMRIPFEDADMKNLFAFLDRVEVKGLKEIVAMHEIITRLQSSIEEPMIPTIANPDIQEEPST